jgi:hypothetical protein
MLGAMSAIHPVCPVSDCICSGRLAFQAGAFAFDACGVRELACPERSRRAPAVCRPGLPGCAPTSSKQEPWSLPLQRLRRSAAALSAASPPQCLTPIRVIPSGVSRAIAFARSAGTQGRAPGSTVSRAREICSGISLRCQPNMANQRSSGGAHPVSCVALRFKGGFGGSPRIHAAEQLPELKSGFSLETPRFEISRILIGRPRPRVEVRRQAALADARTARVPAPLLPNRNSPGCRRGNSPASSASRR